LLVELDTYINQLNKMRSLLQAADGKGLQKIFSQAQTARQSWIAAIEMAEQVRTYEQGGD
jgi:prephenate dehydrogenase